LGASGEAAFPQASWMGCEPVAIAGYERTLSNLPAYRTERVKFGLGVRSQF